PRVKRIVSVLRLPNATSFRRSRCRPPTSLAAAHFRGDTGATDLSPVALQGPPPARRGGRRVIGPLRAFVDGLEVRARTRRPEEGAGRVRSLTAPSPPGQPDLRALPDRRACVGSLSRSVDRPASLPYPENRSRRKSPREPCHGMISENRAGLLIPAL